MSRNKEDFQLIIEANGWDKTFPEWILFFLSISAVLVVLIDPFDIFW